MDAWWCAKHALKQATDMTPIHHLLNERGIRVPVRPNATLGMTRTEAGRLLDALLTPTTHTYVEWGSGGSTELVNELLLAKALPSDFLAISIQSNPRWMEHMRQRSPRLSHGVETGQLRLVHGDMGATGSLGYPLRFDPAEDKARVLPYVSLHRKLNGRKADLVLVDGRFRLACMMEALPHLNQCSSYHACTQHPIVLLHDYLPKNRARATYERARAFYHLLYRNGSLATLIPKRDVDNVDIAETLTYALGVPT